MPDSHPPDRPSRMKIVSIRMSEDTWEAIQAESVRAGISASEFIREAAMVRLGFRWGRRDDLDALTQRLRELGVLHNDY
jgi:Ribbon-helix-helix protein, copG family